MTKCYLCNETLDAHNSSYEHIIPNCIGGRLKITGLICENCNKTTGLLYDSEFAKIGNYLASKYNIKREKGTVQNFRATELTTGKPIKIEPGLKTSFVEPVSGYDNKMIFAEHRDKKRAIEELKRLSKQLGDDEVDPDKIFFENKPGGYKIDFLFDESIEPELILRSVCKTIVNLYLYKTEDLNNCLPIIDFLRQDIENRFCWFLDLDVSKAKNNGAPYHTLIIKGEKRNKILYAYFEMFGEAGFLALINGRYLGEDQQITYTFNPINAVEVNSNYDFNLKPSDIFQHLMTKPESAMVKCIHHH